MSYTMVVTYKCDNCGLTVERNQMTPPADWGGPHAFVTLIGDRGNAIDWCSGCEGARAAAGAQALVEQRESAQENRTKAVS